MSTVTLKSAKVGKFVSTAHVDTVIKNYKQERWAENSKRLGKEDSLSVWFSVEDLEAFLGKLKDHGGDGVRFYFGVYDKEYTEQPLYAGRQTLVMVATKQKEIGGGLLANKDLYVVNGDENKIIAYNTGTLCPPICKPPIKDDDGFDIGITIVDKGEDGMVVI
jgi:hypothetical protein